VFRATHINEMKKNKHISKYMSHLGKLSAEKRKREKFSYIELAKKGKGVPRPRKATQKVKAR